MLIIDFICILDKLKKEPWDEKEEAMPTTCSLPHEQGSLKYCSECGEIINARLTPLQGCEGFHNSLQESGCNYCHECGEQLRPIFFEGTSCPECHFDVSRSTTGFLRKFECLTCQREFEL